MITEGELSGASAAGEQTGRAMMRMKEEQVRGGGGGLVLERPHDGITLDHSAFLST